MTDPAAIEKSYNLELSNNRWVMLNRHHSGKYTIGVSDMQAASVVELTHEQFMEFLHTAHEMAAS
jgi:hypothetical protein